MGTNLWRNRHRERDVDESLNTVTFAVEKGIVGVGWPVPAEEDESLSWEEYEDRAQKLGFMEEDAWVRSLTAIHEHMNEGDLCYGRDEAGRFYLGRVHGPWRYEPGPEFDRHGLVNVRECEWYRIPEPEETVPPELMESFGRGAVLQRVQDPRLVAYSQRLFEKLDGRDLYDIELPYRMDEWFSDEDLKDIVALYLQASEDQVLLPSTVDQQPFKPDGITVNRMSADRTLYEIQHEEIRLPREAYSDDDRRIVYLRRDDNAPDYLYDHVEVLELEDLKVVFDAYWDLLPRRIRIIAETLRDRGDLEWTGMAPTLQGTASGSGKGDGEPEPVASGRRRWVDGMVGFLLAVAAVGLFAAWLGAPDSAAKESPRGSVTDREMAELRTDYREAAARRDELQQTVNEMEAQRADRADAAAAQSRRSEDWVEVRVRWADTLSELFYRLQVSDEHYEAVIRRNDLQNPDLIYEGSTLSFPTRASEAETVARTHQTHESVESSKFGESPGRVQQRSKAAFAFLLGRLQ